MVFPFIFKLIYHLREFALCYKRHPESMRGWSGVVLPAVTPFRRAGDFVFFSSWSMDLNHSTSPNIALKILPFFCFTQPNIVRKPALLVFYATRHRSKSCPSCVLGHPKKVPTKKHKKGKQKVGTKIRPKIVVFQLKIHPFLSFRQIGTAHGP